LTGSVSQPLWVIDFYASSQYYIHRCGLLLQMENHVLSDVGLSVTIVSHEKRAEPIEMSFGMWTPRWAQEAMYYMRIQIPDEKGQF